MIKYLGTTEELESVALADLGLMTSMTWKQAQARAVAVGWGGCSRLMVTLRYKPGKSPIGIDAPYPIIAQDEWDLFVSQIDEYLREVPRVYVVDGTKYTARNLGALTNGPRL